MELTYAVEELDESLEAAYRRLLPEQDEVNGQGKLDWRFRRNPHGRGRLAVARDREGDVVGLTAYIPARIVFDGGEAIGWQALDSVVAPEARGLGVFTRLGRTFRAGLPENGAQAIWGFPNANAAPAWFGKLDWTRLEPPPFLVRPLRSGWLTRKLGLKTDLRLTLMRDSGAPLIEGFGPAFDEAARTGAIGGGPGVLRDAAYLNWRLMSCPWTQYRVVGEGGPTGAPSWMASVRAEKHGGSIAYVLGLEGPDRRIGDLLRAELGRLADQGCEMALAWAAPWTAPYAAFRRCGFTPLPERLRPVVLHFGAWAASPGAAALTRPRAWRLAYADSDTI